MYLIKIIYNLYIFIDKIVIVSVKTVVGLSKVFSDNLNFYGSAVPLQRHRGTLVPCWKPLIYWLPTLKPYMSIISKIHASNFPR